MAFRGIHAKAVKFQDFNADIGQLYYAHPLATVRYPGIVMIYHSPGVDE